MEHFKLIQLVSLILIKISAFGQFEFGHSNAQNLLLGSSAKVNTTAFSIFENVALLRPSKNFQLGIAAQNSFLIKDLNKYYFATSISDSKNKFSLGIAYNGFEAYNESIAKLGYGRIVTEKFNLGFSFNCLRQFIIREESKLFFNFDFAFQGNLNNKLSVASSIKNPLPVKSTSALISNFYGSIDFAISYLLNKKCTFSIHAYKPIEKELSLGFGLNYNFIPQISALFGFQSSPQIFGIGLSLHLGKTKLNTATIIHQNLGLAPNFDFSFISN